MIYFSIYFFIAIVYLTFLAGNFYGKNDHLRMDSDDATSYIIAAILWPIAIPAHIQYETGMFDGVTKWIENFINEIFKK